MLLSRANRTFHPQQSSAAGYEVFEPRSNAGTSSNIHVTREEQAQLSQVAQRTGRNAEEVVREAINSFLQHEKTWPSVRREKKAVPLISQSRGYHKSPCMRRIPLNARLRSQRGAMDMAQVDVYGRRRPGNPQDGIRGGQKSC
jgi:hypothetical protein